MKKNFKIFFFALLLLYFLIFLEKIHHILCSIGPSINFELSEVKIRQKLDKKMWNFEIWWFFFKNCILGHLQAFLGVKHKIKVLRIKKYAFIVIFSKIEALEVLKKNLKNLSKCRTSQPCLLPLDTFWVAKYPKTVQFSSDIPFWKAIKLTIPELLSVL